MSISKSNLGFGRAYLDDSVAERYGSRHRLWRRRISHFREARIIERLLDPAERRGVDWVLDAPCGSGRFTSALRALGYRVLALDSAPAMARQAGESGCDGVLIGSLRELPFADGALDAMICVRFLHHLREHEERLACLLEMARVARGPIVASAWIETPWKRWRRARKERQSSRYLVSMDELQGEFDEARLTVTRSVAHFPFWSPQVYFRLEPAVDEPASIS